MDNNNQNNTQNNGQNGYTNFNNYQPSEAPQTPGTPSQQPNSYQPPAQGTPQPNPYQQPYQPYPYQAVQPNKNRSLVLGIISIVLDCLSYCFAYFAFAGAIVGLVGVIRNKKSVVSWIGFILGVLISIGVIVLLVYAFTHPEFLRAMFEQAGYDQELIDEMMQLFETVILNMFN